MRTTQSPEAGERTQNSTSCERPNNQAGHDYPSAQVRSNILSDDSLTFDIFVHNTTIYCPTEADANRYAAAINAAITNAILGL